MTSTPLPFSLRYDLTRGDLGLAVEETLDRESIASYTFDILAHDGGNRTGAVRVHVIIHDVNDSPPKFDQLVYTVSNISETIPRGSILLRIHATDDDTGINGEVSYHFVRDEPCFTVDEHTGDVRVQCPLDYETRTKYQLDIEARDKGEGFKTDFCT